MINIIFKREQGGFTIIESVLFLAISGFMFLIAFQGISGRIQDVQFTDSVRSLEAYITRKFNEVDNGLILRPDSISCTSSGSTIDPDNAIAKDRGTSQACVVNGVELVFSTSNGAVIGFSQVASKSLDPSIAVNEAAQLSDSNLSKIIPTTSFPYETEWGLELTGIKYTDNPADPFLVPGTDVAIRYVRSQVSTNTYLIASGIPALSGGALGEIDRQLTLCYTGTNGLEAAIEITPKGIMTANFNSDYC